ncbi:MAG: VWA domain-containing protein [Planctomycetota bacterium]|nr:VWA domain-containing protein [Planctomycetota bacterium]
MVSWAQHSADCRVPPERLPISIQDDSQLETVAAVLSALEKTGSITLDGADPDLLIVRGAAATSHRPVISFPQEQGTLFLPRAMPASTSLELLDGLHPRYWTIFNSQVAAGDPLLIDQQGQGLICRTDTGFHWGFLPEDGDLWRRSDWPVLLGRMIEELVPSPTRNRPSMRAMASTQMSLILAVLLALCGSLWLGRGGHLATLLIAGAIVAGQWPTTSRPIEGLANLERISAATDPGQSVSLLDSAPPAAPDLIERLQQRGVGISLVADPNAEFDAPIARIRPGQRHSIPGWKSAIALSPLGTRTEIEFPWTPEQAGVWQLEPAEMESTGEASPRVVVIVEPSIDAALWSEADSIAAQLLPEPQFSLVGGVGNFPEPAAGSVIVWNSSPIAARHFEPLVSWIERGGTFLALPADRFCDDEKTRLALEQILATSIPAAPEPPLNDLGVLLLDLSGSLSGAGSRVLLEGTMALLEGTPRNSRWGVAGFRDRLDWIIEPGTPIESSWLDRIPAQITSGGGTDLGHALRLCRQSLVAHDGGRSLVVITDGRSTPDDWVAIGDSLKRDAIELDIVLVGETIERSVVELLCRRAGGDLHHARSSSHASALLQEAVQPAEQGWQPVEAPVQVSAVDRFIEAGPRLPPVPIRRVAIDSPSRHPDGKWLWVDGSGSPILAIRPIDKGISATWYSGLDRFSLAGSVAETHAHLSQLLAAAAERRQPRQRKGFITQTASGQSQLWWSRQEDDRLSGEIFIGRVGKEATPLRGVATPGKNGFVAPLPAPPGEAPPAPIWWSQGSHLDAGSIPARGNARSWRAVLGERSLAPAVLGPPVGWLLVLAAASLLSSRVRQGWDRLLQGGTAAEEVQHR